MLVTLIHEFVDLHRTGRFLIGICQRHSTATCNATQFIKQLHDVESMFEKGFNVRLRNLNVLAVVNTVMQLGMTYDYIMYINLVISRMHTVIQHLESYILYYLVLSASGKDGVLDKVRKLDEKCATELATEWAKVTSLNEADYVISFREGFGEVISGLRQKLKASKKKSKIGNAASDANARRSSHFLSM